MTAASWENFSARHCITSKQVPMSCKTQIELAAGAKAAWHLSNSKRSPWQSNSRHTANLLVQS